MGTIFFPKLHFFLLHAVLFPFIHDTLLLIAYRTLLFCLDSIYGLFIQLGFEL